MIRRWRCTQCRRELPTGETSYRYEDCLFASWIGGKVKMQRYHRRMIRYQMYAAGMRFSHVIDCGPLEPVGRRVRVER